MKKETLFVAFSTQKGGMGKTALTVLMASHLHYVKGYHVGIIDCDFPQHSISEMRKRDTELVMKDDYFKRMAFRQFSTLGIKAYPVKESTADKAIQDAEEMMDDSEKEFDIIFFDLPGTLNSGGVIKTLATMDYVFTPVSADRVVLESTLQYAIMLNDNLITTNKGNIKGLFLFWNMVDGREKTSLYEAYEKAIAELGLQILKTLLPDSKRFRKEVSDERKTVFRSTLFPIDKVLLKGSNINELVEEICQIINLQNNGNE
ncbi:CobQ/CobB/MinD/ParA nucleotide binding domain protein [Bacteroidales bacterium Barb7]|nr:CobQ/CobB/MinD/ParA nucleotide binding domain protein [Bacteroidales bacterium Barb7]